MKLARVKLANSVKVGNSGEEAVFFMDREYDLELVNSVLIKIRNKRTQQTVYTSLFNTIYFNEAVIAEPTSDPLEPAKRSGKSQVKAVA